MFPFYTITSHLLTPLTKPRQHLVAGLVAMLVVGLGQVFYPKFYTVLNPDSASYLQLFAYRHAIYPLFLDMLGDNLKLIVAAQVLIYLCANFVMFTMLARAGLPLAVLAVFLLAVASDFYSHAYHYTVQTESLSISLIYLMLGSIALYLAERRPLWLGLAMLWAMLIFGIRQTGLPFPIAIAIVAILCLWFTPKPHQLARTAAALLIPIIAVVGLESAYFYAHHGARDDNLLNRHLFGRAVIVLALNGEDGTASPATLNADDRTTLQPFVEKFATSFNQQKNIYWDEGSYCMWLRTHERYEEAVYVLDRDLLPADAWNRKFALRILSHYPLTVLAGVAKYYALFFCVASSVTTETPLTSNEFVEPDLSDIITSVKTISQFLHLAFLLLGVVFFVSKIWYVYRWGRLLLAKYFRREINSLPPQILLQLQCGGACILMVVGYHLFIAIFSAPYIRFLVLSLPLLILAILLMLTTMLAEWQKKA